MNDTRRNRGVLLIMAVMVILMVAGMVTTVLTVTLSSSRREAQQGELARAREIAEAGVDLSLNELRKATDGSDNDGDGDVDEGIENEDLFAPATVERLEGKLGRLGTSSWDGTMDGNGNGLPDFGETGVTPLEFGGGRYIVYTVFSERDGLDNDGNGEVDDDEEAGSVTVVSVGRFRAYEATVTYRGLFTELLPRPEDPPWTPDVAIASGGDLLMSGSALVGGEGGSLHANHHLHMSGSADVSGNVTACLGCSVSDTGSVGGVIDGASPRIDIPNVDPEDFREDADFVLASDGTVTDAAGAAVAGGLSGWRYSNGTWSFSGSSVRASSTFFVEGDVSMSGSGTGRVNVNTTVIATGSISLTGNGIFKPALHPYLLVAGGDVSINGTVDQLLEGIILAREQIEVLGNPVLQGVIMAADLDDASRAVTVTRITGNMTITYDGGLTTDIEVVPPTKRFVLDPTFASFREQTRGSPDLAATP